MKSTLKEILAERERRAERRAELLAEYKGAFLSLTLNIAGEAKAFPLARRCFDEEIRTVQLTLKAEHIPVFHQETSETNAGYAAFLCAGCDARAIKSLAVHIEDTHPLGRLFDIDVFDADGVKLSRDDSPDGNNARPCLVCGGNAFACARSRAHPVDHVTGAALRIMRDFLRSQVKSRAEQAALKAMLYEAAVTPKPGLVDRENNGAHDDMNFFTFIDSAAAVFSFFGDCAVVGFDSGEYTPPDALFDSLRAPGRLAEEAMKEATGGVNTHKGVIFSLGVLSAAYGRLFARGEAPVLDEILKLAKDMTHGILDDFSRGADDSHGMALHKRFGATGVRGEASAGFPSVRAVYGIVREGILAGSAVLNGAGIAAFLRVLGGAEDTNIVSRAEKNAGAESGMETLARIQTDARDFLDTQPSAEMILQKARELDVAFIAQNISPGGCADLLAAAFFLALLLV
ncbi:MAG: triphosphoribosyl-dephospho-CoA synthase CitG [Treponemataceae bacterium]|nr:MAG: triphosphoribosyl-dephospho-CoA synthase CitG [Treponemataceae bacterium]